MYEKFKKLLERDKKTTYRVAVETGLSPTLFSDWKRGKSNPKVDKLMILAEYFGVPLDYFVK